MKPSEKNGRCADEAEGLTEPPGVRGGVDSYFSFPISSFCNYWPSTTCFLKVVSQSQPMISMIPSVLV